MRLLRYLPFLALIAVPGFAFAQTGCARLSWGTCDPWVADDCWQGPGHYPLVASVYGLKSLPMVGTDVQIRIRGVIRRGHCFDGYADAWRFGEGQCEGPGRIAFSRSSPQPSCPTLAGDNPLLIAQEFVDPDNSLAIRLAETHDPITPDPLQRYHLWSVTFDLTRASVGPSPADLSTCGDIDAGANLSYDFAYVLQLPNTGVPLRNCDYVPLNPGASATWNGGIGICDDFAPTTPRTNGCGPVPTQPSTWGRVKATYH